MRREYSVRQEDQVLVRDTEAKRSFPNWPSLLEAIAADHPDLPLVASRRASIPWTSLPRVLDGSRMRAIKYRSGGIIVPGKEVLHAYALDPETCKTARIGTLEYEGVIVSPLGDLWEWDAGENDCATKLDLMSALALMYRRTFVPGDILSVHVYRQLTPKR